MRRLPVRLIVLGLAASSMVAIPLSEAASAVTPVTCSKLSAPAPKGTTSTATISGCTNVAATGGGGTQVTNITKLTFVITWNAGKGTTTAKIAYKAQPSKGKCPAGTVARIGATGTVTGGTGAALKAIPKGSKYSESVCYNKTNVTTIEPGTKMVL